MSPHRWDPDGLCQRPGPHAAWGRSQHSGWSHGPGCPGPRGARAALSGETSLTLLFIHSISKERSTILLRSDNRKRLAQALVLSRDGTSLREKQFGPWGAEGGGGATGHTQSLGEGTSQGTHGRPGGRGRPQRAAPPGQASRTGTLARPRGRRAGRVMRPSPFGPGRAGDPPPPQSFRGAAPHSWAGCPPSCVSRHCPLRKREPVYAAGLLTGGSGEGGAQCPHERAHGDSHQRQTHAQTCHRVKGTPRTQHAVRKPLANLTARPAASEAAARGGRSPRGVPEPRGQRSSRA